MTDLAILERSVLIVDNGTIRVETVLQTALTAHAREKAKAENADREKLEELERRIREAVDDFVRRGALAGLGAPGGRLHKGLLKGLHKGLVKSVTGAQGELPAATGWSWPAIDVPWKEFGALHRLRDHFRWDRLPIDPPPPPGYRLAEATALLDLQEKLQLPENAPRRARIPQEAGNDITAYMEPLGADMTSPASATAVMFQTLIWLGGLIGQHYKARFMAGRPSVLEPNLRPFLPVPAHSSYPSNHAFQSYLIAELFARTVPEHPGIMALFRAAGEVAVNREWAGLHLPSDTAAGRRLARLAMPVIEAVMAEQCAAVRAEWT